MIARRRGEHDVRQAWWPRRHGRAVTSASEAPGAGSGGEGRRSSGGAARGRPGHAEGGLHSRRVWLLGSLAAVGLTGLGFAAGELVHRSSGGPRPTLPAGARAALVATPREWLHEFSTYSSGRPALICSRLFAPAFAAVYRQDTGTSCGHYLARSRVTPLKLRHILQDGSAAVLELGTDSRADWTIVLARQPGGWRQIDFIAGTPAR
jgi:hypothetical protein